MEITRDALLRIVKAARLADKLAQDMQMLFVNSGITVVDEIDSMLNDVLFEIGGESPDSYDDFIADSKTIRLIRSMNMSDEQVAKEFETMYKESQPKMPKPNLVSRDKLNEMLGNCGYRPTAEGEWER